MLADSAHAGRWTQGPAEDLDETLAPPRAATARPSAAPTAPAVSLPAVAGWVGGVAGGVAGWVGQTASSAATTVSDAAGAAGEAVGHRLGVTAEALKQFTWEVEYVFGINGTPVAPVHVSDGARAVVADTMATDGKAAPAPPPGETAAAPTPAPAPKAAEPKPPAEPPRLRTSEPPPAAAPAPAPEPVDTRTLAGLALDKSQRRPDGSYFVPKPLQRLFEIRTQKADTRQSALTVRLPGRIVPDPNAHGDVEASLLGRIEPPRTGFPVLGQTVKQGEVLGYVTPAVGVVDRSQVKREVARLTNEIRISAESLEILKQFWFVPFRDGKILQAETKLDGLRRERAALLPMLQTQEVLRAASDGVISLSNAINGRVVHPGEKIFEIVSPQRLWIEAVAADPDMVRDAVAGISALAVTPEGQTLDLTYIGSGLALQQQSVPVMFRIDTPIEGLRVGRPVTVSVRNRNKLQQGIPLPREALVADSSGAEQVWELVEPEVFMPHTVKTEVLDGRNVLIVAGVEPGARIVTRGSRLLSQLQ
ncbi:HlyD family efflux transporter periplasmic adaptor subunit [Azospirillum sp. TSO22-1]|uniref:efflux RND transporter periplasmic adaptor subunit n=1 Tax=Azospirillum sp. TSO22-1 TaxID=716789 RepID=UPI001FFFFE29|nr:HlyD family efflux transporter periplasmic adaptor subunit [Azospirillum sp. TSO22-1]